MSRRTCWRFFPLLAIWLLLPLSNAYAGNLTLAVAANFTDTTASLVETFETATGHQVTASFGSSVSQLEMYSSHLPSDPTGGSFEVADST